MPEKVVISKQKIDNIVDSINQKTGKTEQMTLDQIPPAISSLNNIKSHSELSGRNDPDQHSIEAITGLQAALNDKLEESALTSAINTALAQAKASGDFNGKDGASGKSIAWGLLSDLAAVSDTHATITNIIKNRTRIAAPVKNAASFRKGDLALLPGQYNDAPRQHYWMLFEVDKVAGSQLQGYPLNVVEEGLPGKTPMKGTDYWTTSDKQGIVNDVLAALPKAKGVDF